MFSPMLKSFCCFIYQGCGCHMVGSVSPTCSTNGRCRCKPGFGGYKCDRCISSTYYGFPNCKRKWIFLLSTVDFLRFIGNWGLATTLKGFIERIKSAFVRSMLPVIPAHFIFMLLSMKMINLQK